MLEYVFRDEEIFFLGMDLMRHSHNTKELVFFPLEQLKESDIFRL